MNLADMPTAIAVLPRDERGYPIPWFVATVDGVRDFRVAGGDKFVRAIRDKLCWVCGGALGKFKAFVLGPMCSVNRTSAEPPCHRECALFSARVCPFLTKPRMRRNEHGMPPPESCVTAGVALKRNPGVALVWVVTSYKWFKAPMAAGEGTGILLDVGEPIETLWFAKGRSATRGEVEESVDTGLPSLRAMCSKPEEFAELDRRAVRAAAFYPAA